MPFEQYLKTIPEGSKLFSIYAMEKPEELGGGDRQREGVHLQARSPVGMAGKAGTLRRAALGAGRGVPGAGPQAEGGWGLAAARAWAA